MSTLIFANNAITTLAAPITSSATTVSLAAGSGVLFPEIAGDEYFVCTLNDAATGLLNEIVYVTAATGDSFTIVRGQEGTTARAWRTGDTFKNLWTAGQADTMLQQGQAQSQATNYGLDTGTENAYVVALNPVLTQHTAGMPVRVKIANTSSGASTLNPGPGVKPILNYNGAPIEGAEIIADSIATFIYDGAAYRLQNGSAVAAASGATGSGVATGGETTITLSEDVPSDWMVQIFVGNTPQQPGTDYTCSGTDVATLTTPMTPGTQYWWIHNVGSLVSNGAVQSVNGQTGAVNLTTTDIPEGDELYFTDQRAKDAVLPELANSDGSSLIGFIQSGTGAVSSTAETKLRQRVTLEDFGAVGDGVTDDAGALVNALNSGSGIIHIGPKTYRIGSAVTTNVSNVSIVGSVGKSVFHATFAAGDVLCFGNGTSNPNNIVVDGVSFTTSISRTSGSALRARNGHNINFRNIRMDGDFWDGVVLDGGVQQFTYRFENYEINNVLNNSLSIGTDGTLPQDVYLLQGVTAGAGEYGIYLQNVSGLWMTNLEVLGCKNGVGTNPSFGETVQFVFAENVISDTCDENALSMNTDGGIVQLFYGSGCWWASSVSENGIQIDQGSGEISDVYFRGNHLINNFKCGALITNASRVYFDGVDALGNSTSGINEYDAIRFVSGNNFGVSQLTVGPVPNLGINNTRYGVVFEATTDYVIADSWGDIQSNTGKLLNLCSTTNVTISNILDIDEFSKSFKRRIGDYRVDGKLIVSSLMRNEADAYVSPSSGDTIHTGAGTDSGTDKYTGAINQNVLIDNGAPIATLTIQLPTSERGRYVTYSCPQGVVTLTVQNSTGGTSDIRNPSGLSGRLSGGGALRMKCMFDTLVWVEC